MVVGGPREAPRVESEPTFPVNRGALCIKGWTAAGTLRHPERLTRPLVRRADGQLAAATWDEALDRTVAGIRDLQSRYGRDAVGVFGGGSLTNEKAYLLGKFARVALRTRHIDYNGRFCMSSAAAASIKAFGVDRGLPFPVHHLAGAGTILLVGSNLAETMPPVMRYLDMQRARGGALIVADPRRTPTAQAATLHLPLAPGSDAALANGLLHILIRDGLVDRAYVRSRTEGFERARAMAASYWPGRVERITGVREAELERAARLLGTARSSMVLTGRGPEQQAQGVANTLAFINVALALGQVGGAFGGYGCLTGQGNGQGGREHGQKADQLPGYRRIDDPAARAHVAAVWGVREEDIPGPGVSAFEMLDRLGPDGGIRSLLVFGSNPAVCAPDARRVEARLRSLDLLVVSDFFLSETAALADVVLPSAQWAEEEGTMTNLEGRVLLRRRAMAPPADVRDDLQTLGALADGLGRGRFFRHREARAVFDELRRASAGGPADYSGITYEKLEERRGVYWPCPDEGHPGTARMFVSTFPRPGGRALFHAVSHLSPAEEPEPDYPLVLTTGRVLAQYQTGTQTRRLPELTALAAGPCAEMHPALARRHGIREGDAVSLTTRRGRATFEARLTDGIREDTVFVPFHWGGEGRANSLTNAALDPASRMPEFKVCAARLERAGVEAAAEDTGREGGA